MGPLSLSTSGSPQSLHDASKALGVVWELEKEAPEGFEDPSHLLLLD